MSTVPYVLVRSARKTLALEITRDGKIVVRAPVRLAQRRIDQSVEEHQEWIREHLAVQQRRRENHPEPDGEERQKLIQLAKDVLPQKVRYYSDIMGLFPTGISITNAEKRFGSCSWKNRLCFSWRLMMYPEEAVDYVVVHELAHIQHKNHGKDFYRCVEKVMPDWRERRKLLKE